MVNKTLNQQIAAQIIRLRKEQGLTQEELAEKAGTDFSYIGRIERNQVNFSVHTVDKIITALEVTPAEFFEFLKLEDSTSEIFELLVEINTSEKRDILLNMIKDMLKLTKWNHNTFIETQVCLSDLSYLLS